MAKVRIDDLDEDVSIDEDEMRKVFGGNVDLQNMLDRRRLRGPGNRMSPWRRRGPVPNRRSYPGLVTPNC